MRLLPALRRPLGGRLPAGGVAAPGGGVAPASGCAAGFPCEVACSDLTYSISASSCSSLIRPWKVGMTGWNPATIFAAGDSTDSRTYASSAVDRPGRSPARPCCRTGLERGARAPGPSSRWQVLQARSWKSFWPCDAIDPSAAPPPSHAWYSFGSITTTLADHPGVLRAAVLRAEEVVLARLGRVEPERRVAARDHVGLHAERRHEEGVDDVLGGRRQPHGPPDRHVQLVDLALPVGVLELPHPLLAHDVDVQGLGRRPGLREVDVRAPDEHHQADDQRDDRPADLERERRHHPDADSRRARAAGTGRRRR